MNQLVNLNDELFQPLTDEEQSELTGGSGQFTVSVSVSITGPDADIDGGIDWGN